MDKTSEKCKNCSSEELKNIFFFGNSSYRNKTRKMSLVIYGILILLNSATSNQIMHAHDIEGKLFSLYFNLKSFYEFSSTKLIRDR